MKKWYLYIFLFYAGPIRPVFEKFNAWRAYQKNDLGEAQRYLDTVLVNNPDDFSSLYNAGKVAYAEKGFEKAVAYFSKAALTDDVQLKERAYFDLGNSLVRCDKLKEAADSYEQVLKINEHNEYAKKTLEEIKKRLEREQQKQDNEQKDQDNSQKQNENQEEQKQNGESQNDDENDNQADPQNDKQDQSDNGQNQDDKKQDDRHQQDKQNSSLQHSLNNNSPESKEETHNPSDTNKQKKPDQARQQGNKDASKNEQQMAESPGQQPGQKPDRITQFFEALEQEDTKNAKKMLQQSIAQESFGKRHQRNW